MIYSKNKFMKSLIVILSVFLSTSCESLAQKEANKSAKHSSASDRINSTNSNSDSLLKELDE